MMQRYVYVIACAGYHKVGVATNPIGRMGTMQTGNPIELRIVRAYEVPAESAHYAESWAHFFLQDYSVRGEWFNAPEALILSAVERGIAKNDTVVPGVTVKDFNTNGKRRKTATAKAPKCKVCGSEHWGAVHVFPPENRMRG